MENIKDEAYMSALQARVSAAVKDYREASRHDKDHKHDDSEPEMMRNFAVRISKVKHRWCEDNLPGVMKEIDNEIQSEGYEYLDSRGSSQRYGRGYIFTRLGDTFTGLEDALTRALHHRYLDPCIRIALMIKNGATDEEIIKNESEIEYPGVLPLPADLVHELIDHARDMVEMDEGECDTMSSFRTTLSYRDQIKFGTDSLVILMQGMLPIKYRPLKGSTKFVIKCLVELLILRFDSGYKHREHAYEYACGFWDVFEPYIKDFRRSSEFVKVGSSIEQLDLMR